MWDFATEPEKLDWMDKSVQDEVEPIDARWGDKVYERPMDPSLARIIAPRQEQVQPQRLVAAR